MNRYRSQLRQLDPIDRFELIVVWWILLMRQRCAGLPFVLKLGAGQAIAMFAILAAVPPHFYRPLPALGAIWAASLCCGFIIAVALPWHRRQRGGSHE